MMDSACKHANKVFRIKKSSFSPQHNILLKNEKQDKSSPKRDFSNHAIDQRFNSK